MRENLRVNEFENATVVQVALSNVTAPGKLMLADDSQWFKLATSRNAVADSDGESITVPVYTLDDLVEERAFQPPDFVMIDVEGSEIEVFRGMQKIISEYRPAIICEIHWLKKEVTEILEKVFYPLDTQQRSWTVRHYRRISSDITSYCVQFNLFALFSMGFRLPARLA